MDELIKALDPGLDYIEHEVVGDEIIVYVSSNRKEAVCPYCGEASARQHSAYARFFYDLPISGLKTKVVINNRKMFCDNPECSHRTFAETFDFIGYNARKTNRLLKKIIDLSLGISSTAASELLRKGIVDIGKSSICNLLKKTSSR